MPKSKAKTANLPDRSTLRYQSYRGRRKAETDLWHTWNNSGRQDEHLEPLLKSLDPMIQSEARRRMQGLGGTITKPSLVQELRLAATKSIHSFDPERGAQLSTHVTNGFQRVTDFIAHNRNPKSIPKAFVEKWGPFNNAVVEFQEMHGRPPTTGDLQTQLGWDSKTVKRMQRSFGREAFTDMGTELEHGEAGETPLQQVRTAFMLNKSRMSPEEQSFSQMHYPPDGVRQMSVASIAKKLGISEARAYRIKRKVENMLAPTISGR